MANGKRDKFTDFTDNEISKYIYESETVSSLRFLAKGGEWPEMADLITWFHQLTRSRRSSDADTHTLGV